MSEFRTLTEGGACCTEHDDCTFPQSYDVIIVGGGTAGSMAACYLAQKKKTLVIEKMKFLGGMHSSGMFAYYMGSTGGLYESFDKEIKAMEKQYQIDVTYGSQPLYRMHIYEEYLQKQEVDVAYDAVITGVYVEQNKLCGVQYLQQGKLIDVRSKMVIDASADAVVCRMAGIKTQLGRACDKLCQPFSNVRIYFDREQDRVEINNIDAGYLDSSKPQAYAKGVLHSLNNAVYDHRREQEITLGMSPMLGIRESHRIVGKDTLTMQQVLDGQLSLEPLFYTTANIDNHAKDVAFESDAVCDWIVAMSLWSIRVSLPIKKEYLIPYELDNVVIAGRNLSLDHDVASHTRMMRDCQKGGEAAGILVNAAIDQHCMPNEVAYDSLVKEVREHGCLQDENNIKIADNAPLDIKEEAVLPTTLAEAKLLLCSDRPGLGMLAAYRLHAIQELSQWLHEDDENLQIHSAIVLALLGNDQGYDQLLQAAKRRDSYLPKTSKSYNTLRGISCLYALGKLPKKGSGTKLLAMLKQHEDFQNDAITFDKFIGSKEDYHFQYVSHLIRALFTIGMEGQEEGLIEEVLQIVEDERFNVQCTLKANPMDQYDMKQNLQKYMQWRLRTKERED